MVIHPPTLFLGFALTLVPFAFAVTGIFRSDHRGWIKPALPWALVGGMILGTGIIMGGFWAYESLSFGGYWAWDPVENASLVPWLMLIAGIHLMLIKKTTNSATIASYLLILGTFVLVLYATFLTRSGVLGETSVHAFTDLDLSGQLMQFVVIFIWLPIVGVTRKLRDKLLISAVVLILILLLPFQEKFAFYSLLFMSLSGLAWFGLSLNRELASSKQGDDNIWSREFWMFIGSLIITVAAVQIMFTTSIPVFNKIFGTNAAPPTDPIAHYNKYQLPFAIVITILVSIGQYFQYRNTVDKRKFKANILYLAIASIIVTILEVILFQLRTPFYMVFLLTCTYAILANLNYLINQLKGKILYSGASIAHVGFGLMLVGILVSSANKRIITKDLDGSMQGFDQRYRMENMRLWQDEPTRLGDFWVTYLGDSTEGPNTYFMVNYTSLDSTEVFTLYPNAQISERDGMMANPDTRHYITYDVYTHVTSIPNPNDSIEWSNVREYEIELGDTISTANGDIVFNAVEEAKLEQDLKNASVYQAHLSVFSSRGIDEVYPKYIIVDRSNFGIREEVPEIGLRFLFEIRVDSIGPKAILEVAETEPRPRFIVMKAIIFPYINLLWLGTIVMVLGFGIAAFQHIRK
jgi:cytochrome c-type biogenesis protein CcmF